MDNRERKRRNRQGTRADGPLERCVCPGEERNHRKRKKKKKTHTLLDTCRA